MISNILFDMGNVLIRYEPETFVRLSGVEDEEDRALLLRVVFRSIEWVMLDRGELHDEEAIAVMCRKLPERLHGTVRELVSHWADRMLEVDGMLALVQELDAKGYGLYLLTNASFTQRRYFPQYPVAKYFGERIYLSAEHRMLKPEPEIYADALRTFGLDAASCVFIDDSPHNVEAAIRAGMKGIVFHGSAELLRCELWDAANSE